MGKDFAFGRKLLLAGIGIAALAGPLIFGVVNVPRIRAQSAQTSGAPVPSFEVVSIKPNHSGDARSFVRLQPGRFTATAVPTKMLIQFAYDSQDFQLSGGPGWINSEKYDIDAKEEDSAAQALQKLSQFEQMSQIQLMVRSLLADRFKLKISFETKDAAVYALVVANGGPKLSRATATPADTNGSTPQVQAPQGPRIGITGRGQITASGVPISMLAQVLSRQLGRQVVDKTGLNGNYDFTLQWTPDESQSLGGPEGPTPTPAVAPPPDSFGPSVFTAIQEQLGLKLESQKAPVEMIVVDHIEVPSEN
jgi:bla regulator protein BlaR1